MLENDQIEYPQNFNIKKEKEDYMETDNWQDYTTRQPLDLQITELNEENYDQYIDYGYSNNEWMKNEPGQNMSFSCIHCNQIFDEQNRLILHVATEHRNIEKGKKSKKSKKAKKDHEGKKKLKCSVCEKGFGYQKNLNRHLVVVHGEKIELKEKKPQPSPVHPKIPCVECGKLFSETWLRGHMLKVSTYLCF